MARLLFQGHSRLDSHRPRITLFPKLEPIGKEVFRMGDPLLLKRPDGTEVSNRIGGIEFAKLASPQPCECLIMRTELGKQIPIFISLGVTKCHADSQDWLPRNALRASSQRSAFSIQLAGVRLSARLGGLSGRIVAARKDSQV